MTQIALAGSDEEIAACHPVMRELRPHLEDSADFVARVRRIQSDGYRLVALRDEGGAVRACAGYRVQEMLSRGRFLYVDDLVTSDRSRSAGHGAALIEWLTAEARREGCTRIDLDSGVQRGRAHRFYFRHGFTVTGFHFGRSLGEG